MDDNPDAPLEITKIIKSHNPIFFIFPKLNDFVEFTEIKH